MALEHELQVYRTHVLEMLGGDCGNEGKIAVIKGDDVSGPFGTYEDALKAAYERHGLGPFLVKKIERNETVLSFSSDLL